MYLLNINFPVTVLHILNQCCYCLQVRFFFVGYKCYMPLNFLPYKIVFVAYCLLVKRICMGLKHVICILNMVWVITKVNTELYDTCHEKIDLFRVQNRAIYELQWGKYSPAYQQENVSSE